MSLNLNYKANVLVETENLSREKWLEYRRLGIGGSDVAAIMGQSPFCTKRDLYYDKIGRKPVVDEEESNWVAKEVGHRLEELVAEIFSRKMGLKVYPIRKMFRHPHYPFMLADVDFFVEFPDGTTGILECKTTNYNCRDKWANDTIPVNYEYQGRHYLSVMNLNKIYYACLYGNNVNEFIIRCMERDLDIEEEIIAEEENFWKENVEKHVEPCYFEKPDLVLESIRKFCGPAEPGGEAVKLQNNCIVPLKTYLDLKEEKLRVDAQSKRLEEEMKSAYMGIVEELGVNCEGVLAAGSEKYFVSYAPVYRTSIDRNGLEKLQLNHPDIYDDYVKVSESRRFSVKKRSA